MMTHLEGQAPLSKRKDAYVAGVSSTEKLEEMLKEQEVLLAEAEANITTLEWCSRRYQEALSLKWNCRKMISKVSGKLNNLKRVKKADFKLQTWYVGGTYESDVYIYPLRVTPAGRVEVLKFLYHKTYYRWSQGQDDYKGPYWNIAHDHMDSKDLERVAPLTVLVTVGNLNRILAHFMGSEFYKITQAANSSTYFYMDVADTESLEILATYPQLPSVEEDEEKDS